MESVLGEEIVDEVDAAVDMQEVARRRKRDRFKSSKVVESSGDDNTD